VKSKPDEVLFLPRSLLYSFQVRTLRSRGGSVLAQCQALGAESFAYVLLSGREVGLKLCPQTREPAEEVGVTRIHHLNRFPWESKKKSKN